MNFIAFSHYLGEHCGQVFVFFILRWRPRNRRSAWPILVVLFRICRRSTSTISTT